MLKTTEINYYKNVTKNDTYVTQITVFYPIFRYVSFLPFPIPMGPTPLFLLIISLVEETKNPPKNSADVTFVTI